MLVYFEKQEDLVDYLLSFEEMSVNNGVVDVGAFYAPYVPLTVTSAIYYGNTRPMVDHTSRYANILGRQITVYSPADTNGDTDTSL